ncbi:hypothetical protein CVT24_013071 [Panaeolus cyanescens]|uniref:Nephrocystin 3-like N-terminal domain-containing protein n=1 Tax=Panaeolus cyanescens TaxID=181874 RepID=A0A409WA86_9AGAR|nr:hypothetical protein CVT24_013071 [Panaeolus cyanescens]
MPADRLSRSTHHDSNPYLSTTRQSRSISAASALLPVNIAENDAQPTTPQLSMSSSAISPDWREANLINEAPVYGLSDAAQGTPSPTPVALPPSFNPINDVHSSDSIFDVDHRLSFTPRIAAAQRQTIHNPNRALNGGQPQSASTVAPGLQPNQNGTRGAPKIFITNSHFTTANTVVETSSKALKSLYKMIAPAAFHNSLQRCDPPKCHPGTREAIQRQILDFSDDPSKFSAVMMWLYGPAGAGKSAIAQTVAETLFKKQKLAASFFFSQMSKDGHRHNEKRLIATIAYQIMQNAALVRPYIQHEIESNPAIFDMSLEDQIESLILQPFRKLRSEYPAEVVDQIPRTIIIDGLDECSDSAAQDRVLNVLRLLVGDCEAHPFNVIVVSRPETNIMQWFDNKAGSLLEWRLNLQDSREKDDDIAKYVTDELTAVATSYRFKHHLPPGWPSQSVINEIVGKSSGQFIYAATVVRYVEKCQGVPSTQLEGLLSSTFPKSAHPFAELDALYTSIIKKSPYKDDFISITAVVNNLSLFTTWAFDGILWMKDLPHLQQGLSLSAPFDVIISDFGSLFDYSISQEGKDDDGSLRNACWVNSFHKSLLDFITDPTRAPQGHYLDFKEWGRGICSTIYGHLTSQWLNKTPNSKYTIWLLEVYCKWLDYGHRLSPSSNYGQQLVTQWKSLDPSFILFLLEKFSEPLLVMRSSMRDGSHLGLVNEFLTALFQRVLSISMQRLNISSELYIICSLNTHYDYDSTRQPESMDPGWLTLFSMASECGLQDSNDIGTDSAINNAHRYVPFNPLDTTSFWLSMVSAALHYVDNCLYMYNQGATFQNRQLFLEELLDRCTLSAELVFELKQLLPYLKRNGYNVEDHRIATQNYIEYDLYGPGARIDLRAFPKHPYYDDISQCPSSFIAYQFEQIHLVRHSPVNPPPNLLNPRPARENADARERTDDEASSPSPSFDVEHDISTEAHWQACDNPSGSFSATMVSEDNVNSEPDVVSTEWTPIPNTISDIFDFSSDVWGNQYEQDAAM